MIFNSSIFGELPRVGMHHPVPFILPPPTAAAAPGHWVCHVSPCSYPLFCPQSPTRLDLPGQTVKASQQRQDLFLPLLGASLTRHHSKTTVRCPPSTHPLPSTMAPTTRSAGPAAANPCGSMSCSPPCASRDLPHHPASSPWCAVTAPVSSRSGAGVRRATTAEFSLAPPRTSSTS